MKFEQNVVTISEWSKQEQPELCVEMHKKINKHLQTIRKFNANSKRIR